MDISKLWKTFSVHALKKKKKLVFLATAGLLKQKNADLPMLPVYQLTSRPLRQVA